MPQSRYWNLCQTAVWVEYRCRELVTEFEHATRHAYLALGLYPTMNNHKQVAPLSEFGTVLVNGGIQAWGCRADNPGSYELIPQIEWSHLIIRPPIAVRRSRHNVLIEPWTDIRFESGKVVKRWPSTFQQDARLKYRWDRIEAIYRDMRDRNPDISQNELIGEIAAEFQDRYKKDPPSRTTIQRHMKKWN